DVLYFRKLNRPCDFRKQPDLIPQLIAVDRNFRELPPPVFPERPNQQKQRDEAVECVRLRIDGDANGDGKQTNREVRELYELQTWANHHGLYLSLRGYFKPVRRGDVYYRLKWTEPMAQRWISVQLRCRNRNRARAACSGVVLSLVQIKRCAVQSRSEMTSKSA